MTEAPLKTSSTTASPPSASAPRTVAIPRAGLPLPLTRLETFRLWDRVYRKLDNERAARRLLARQDLFFLLTRSLGRTDINREWLFQRCREVQLDPDGYLDLWAREHYKSTIITYGLTIQEILCDPELTFGILSFNRPTAKSFLFQIKSEFEGNEQLKDDFDDVLFRRPRSEAPRWSLDDGIVVRRKRNPKEATVEGWGMVDGMPTGKHWRRVLYDDIITEKSVTTPEMIAKVNQAWELSVNLGADGGARRIIGTRYHFNDTYGLIMVRKSATPRLHPATHNGKDLHEGGKPVLISAAALREKRRDMGPYTFGCQMLQDPVADKAQGFNAEWLRYYTRHNEGAGMNKYILVDPATEKKKESDYTAMVVIGLAADENYYVLDMVRDRLNLTERTLRLFELHRRWKPKGVGYEHYGMQADIAHIKDKQNADNYRFDIIELGGTQPKHDRIRRLIPICEQHKLWLPESLHRTDYEHKTIDLVHVFLEEEFKAFPVGMHEDMLDAMARICEPQMNLVWPKEQRQPYSGSSNRRSGTAMSA